MLLLKIFLDNLFCRVLEIDKILLFNFMLIVCRVVINFKLS